MQKDVYPDDRICEIVYREHTPVRLVLAVACRFSPFYYNQRQTADTFQAGKFEKRKPSRTNIIYLLVN